ncbi:hypothetical protein V6N11_062759 [Hibiscus sabdariffa]|uniref:Clathrin/coatomer adaptor adaptin-like N-terminal domain-containing protein n=1 Tax=Hibiscus sabdariffa TaxID=183260 RepID=A0ABR2PTL5_9ROSI
MCLERFQVRILTSTLDIVLELISPRNINEVVLTLKKQVMKTQREEYRQMLIQAIHSCAIKTIKLQAQLCMDFLGDSNVASACSFYSSCAGLLCALWVIGEYCFSLSEVESALATIKQCLGELPFYSISEEAEATDVSKKTP